MIDRQMNRDPDREIHLAIFSSSHFLKLSYGTDSEAQEGVEGWGHIFTPNLVNLMAWGEVWALNHPGSYPSFTVQPWERHLTSPRLVLLLLSENKCSYLMTLANLNAIEYQLL